MLKNKKPFGGVFLFPEKPKDFLKIIALVALIAAAAWQLEAKTAALTDFIQTEME